MAERSGVTIEFPEQDLREFNRMMEMFETRLGKSSGDAVRFGMFLVGKAAASSTKKGAKRRSVLKNKGKNENYPPSEYPYFIKVWRGDDYYKQYIERKNSRHRKIKRAGLAKNSWKWGLTKIGMKGGKKSGYAGKESRNSMRVIDRHKNLRDPAITMTSKLDYMEEALKYGGDRGVETIMRRASNNMRKYMERRLKETIREKNL